MTNSNFQQINVQKIKRPNPSVRVNFNEEEIFALTESIREKGILVPLLVRPIGDDFEVIDGDCRLEAAFRLRLREIPCVVRNTTDSETHILRMLANLERSNPDVVSEAIYIAKVLQSGILGIEELAQNLNRSVQWIDDRLAIAGMPDFMQEALRQKKVPLGVALILFQIDDEKVRHDWFNSAVVDGMTIRSAEGALREYQRIKEIRSSANNSSEAPVIPVAPPIVLIPCARCGERAPITELKSVLIHRDGCPSQERNLSE